MWMRESWIVQVQLEDKTETNCPISTFKRRLKGTGIEVDMSYLPVRVAPGRFVGRGFATRKVARNFTHSKGVSLFKEIRFPETPESSSTTR